MFHNDKFIICQPARLLKDLIADGNFSDVVQRTGQIHFLGCFFIKSHVAGKLFGVNSHADRMGAGKRRFVIDNLS